MSNGGNGMNHADEIKRLNSELAQSTKTTQVQNIIDENRTLKQQVTSLKEALEVIQVPIQPKQDNNELLTQIKTLQQNKQNLNLTIETLQAQVKDNAQTNDKLRAATRKRAQAQSQLASCNETLTVKSLLVDSQAAEIVKLTSDLSEEKAILAQTKKELVAASSGLEKAQTSLASTTVSLEELNKKHEDLEHKFGGTAEELKSAKIEVCCLSMMVT